MIAQDQDTSPFDIPLRSVHQEVLEPQKLFKNSLYCLLVQVLLGLLLDLIIEHVFILIMRRPAKYFS